MVHCLLRIPFYVFNAERKSMRNRKPILLLFSILIIVSCHDKGKASETKDDAAGGIPTETTKTLVSSEAETPEKSDNDIIISETSNAKESNEEPKTPLSFDDVVFEPLSNNEVIKYEEISPDTYDMRFYITTTTDDVTKRIIGIWPYCMSRPQIIKNGRACFFTLHKKGSTLDYLFYIDGDIGKVSYIMEIYGIYRATFDGKYLIYQDPSEGNEEEIYHFLQYSFLNREKVATYEWKPKSRDNYSGFGFGIQRRDQDRIHIFAYGESICFAELSIDPGSMSIEILWDDTDKRSTDFEVEWDADLKEYQQ